MRYIDRIQNQAKKNWIKYMELDGITDFYTLEEFYAEMQSDINNRIRAINLIEAKIPSTLTLGSLLKGGMTNYFIISDLYQGIVCKKCNASGSIILLLDKAFKSNLNKKILLPSLEYYHALGIGPKDIEFVMHPPIPVNYTTDYWYCPYCNEMHRFTYNNKLGLMYDQEVVKVEIDMKKHLKKYEYEIC